MRIFFVSTFVGTFLPASVGSDVVRAYAVGEEGVPLPMAVASVHDGSRARRAVDPAARSRGGHCGAAAGAARRGDGARCFGALVCRGARRRDLQ